MKKDYISREEAMREIMNYAICAFQPAHMVTAKVMEVLEKLPGVTIDHTEV